MTAIFPAKPDAPDKHIVADIHEFDVNKPEHVVAVDVTVTHPQAAKLSQLSTLEGHGAAAAVAEKVKDDKYDKFHVIPKGGFVPVAVETFGTMGTRGDGHLRRLARDYARPVEWIDRGPDLPPVFVDHGGRYSIFLRSLREHISVALQLGNAEFIRRWIARCVPRVGAAPESDSDEGAGAGAGA